MYGRLKMKASNSKNVTISAIRMLCTSCIVLLHITQQLEQITPQIRVITDWLNLALVMFFSISAFLYSRKKITNILQWYARRFIEIIVPSVLVGLCTVAYYSLHKPLTLANFWSMIMSCTGLHILTEKSWYFAQLWFLSYILFFYLTIPLIQKIPCKQGSEAKFWSLLLGTIAAAQVFTTVAERLTNIPMLSAGIMARMYVPYFVYRRYEINGTSIRPIMYISTILSIILIPVTCCIRYCASSFLPDSVAELLFIYTQTLAGFTLFYWIYQALSGLNNYTWLLRLSDKLSYEVYLTHCLFIAYQSSLIYNLRSKAIGILLALLLTLLFSIAIHYLSKPIKTFFQLPLIKKQTKNTA